MRLLAAALPLLLALAACGSGEPVEGARHGGSVTVAQTSQPDYLDPAMSYTPGGWQPMWLVYTPLLTYRHAEGRAGSELVPGLAEELPEISEGGRRYQLRLRADLSYSDGTPVKASDFEHSIKRVLALGSPGSSFFAGVVGAEEYAEAGDPEGDITGITSDDGQRTIDIRLEEPIGPFSNVLASNFAGLVPGDTPFAPQSKDPPRGVGAFRFGEVVPGRRFTLERNRGFSLPEVPSARLDRVTTRIVKSVRRQTRDVIAGRLDAMLAAPAPGLIGEVRRSYGDRYAEHEGLETQFFFLNTEKPPFDDPRVREAAARAVDRRAIARLLGDRLVPACTVLPPAVPGHEAPEPCPVGEPDQKPDIERARALVRAAGAEGARVEVWGATQQPSAGVVRAFAAALSEAGLDARPKLSDFSVYLKAAGTQATGAQTGYGSYTGDFPHPQNFLFQFSEDAITPTNNLNKSNARDPLLTEKLRELSQEDELHTVASEWADLDHRVVDRAYAVVLGHTQNTTFLSERMNAEACSLYHPIYGSDYSAWCLKTPR